MKSIIIDHLHTMLKGILNLIYPKICLCCDNTIKSKRSLVCEKCWNSIQPLPEQIYNKKPIPSYIDELYISFLFNRHYQQIIHCLKYKEFKTLGINIGKQMIDSISINVHLDSENSIVIPIPLHKIRLRERGFNQAKEIAKGFCKNSNLSMNTNLLYRIKNTKSQTKLTLEERKENMLKAFSMEGKISKKVKYIILIDDVFTTGSTLNSAAKEIKSNWSGKLIGITSAAPE